ncbi:MAG: FAD-binding oxidoreductase [Alphaproteobacteria bacterium]|nr:FAD-binding oxidoreductase [Alphaproteobacteria bacterium]
MNGVTAAVKPQTAYHSWGGLSCVPANVLTPQAHDTLALPKGAYLAYGNGRSYSDTCLPESGTLIGTRAMQSVIAFDPQTGILRAQAGMLMADVLSLAIPHGWFVPVTPGTRWVTLGGAFANDVHGKNHHHRGTFADHVNMFELLRSGGERMLVSRNQNAGWMRATAGDMDLTGLVTWLEVQLMRVVSPWVQQDVLAFETLEDFMALDHASRASHEYTVAWLDAVSADARVQRGVFMRANHVRHDVQAKPDRQPLLSIPFTPPVRPVPRFAIRPFNALYWRMALRSSGKVHDYRPFFYPRDGLGNWNRLYGRAGLRQFQCVLPAQHGADALRALLAATHRHGQPSWLAVLKAFGDRPPAGMLSFARPGLSVALDFPNEGGRTQALFENMQAIVNDAGGAVNAYKDAQWTAETFAKSFPDFTQFEPYMDPMAVSRFRARFGKLSADPALSPAGVPS